MSADPQTPAEPEGFARSPWGLAGIALVAGLLQLIASIALGMARIDRFESAAAEEPGIYLLLAALLTAAAFSVWLIRERPAIAVALTLLWPVGLWYGLRNHATRLGMAFHGEFVLHHFTALLCLVLAIGVPLAWARDPRLGRLRLLPALLVIPGAALLTAAHLAPLQVGPAWLGERWIASLGAGLLLIAWPLSAGLFWTHMAPAQRRPIALVLLLPVVLRLALAGPHGLSGELIPDAGISWLGAAMVVTALATLTLLRPRLDLWVMIVIGAICLVGSVVVYWFYEHGFGELEDGLGGLLQSLFGFQVPYPSYVDDVKSAALMMGLFFMFVTVYAALVSSEDRIRGVALGLMLIAGLGFSSPHLVLMLGVGALLFIETLLPGAPDRELHASGFAAELEALADAAEQAGEQAEGGDGRLAAVRACVDSLAERLHLPPPTVVAVEQGVMVDLRHDLDSVPFDLRARIEIAGTRIELTVGLPGRGDPSFELVADPGDRGQRPAHLLARSHRIVGDARALEAYGDAPLDALTCFRTAYLRAWDGGVQVEFGRDLAGLRVDNLEALLRALIRVVR